MTATATRRACRDIIESLGMFNPAEVIGNPDLPNIYFSASTRPDRGEDKYRTILEPLVQSLKHERENFPFTVIFGNLETISYCYSFFSHSMGNDQYAPKGALHKAENRLFTQFHAQYPLKEKEKIIYGLIKGTSNLRLEFATMAFGVSLDLDFIRQVIHIGVPYTMEEYFQEAGRAGRDGLPSKAHVFYNAYDVSKARKHLSPIMREYVSESDKCKRDMVLEYFGFSSFPRNSDDLHNCCDYIMKNFVHVTTVYFQVCS